MNTTPKISVVMSVYNGERFLTGAVDSILNQTFSDFEFIIVDDGSTDRTREILDSLQDDRIIIIHQENSGVTRALNRAMTLAKGAYIARQDADDLCKPRRLEMQLAFMSEHPEVGLLGTRFEYIDENDVVLHTGLPPLENNALQKRLPQINLFCHGSVLIRREVLDKVGLYREYFKYAQDYDLWLRISEHYEIANLEELLCSYRELSTAISSNKILMQSRYAAVAAEMALQRKASGTDDLSLGKEPALPGAETFNFTLQKKMTTFYAQNPDRLIASLKTSNDPESCFFFERICQERLQYDEELRQKNFELRTYIDTLGERDAQIGTMCIELEQTKQQLDGMKAKGFDAVQNDIATLVTGMHENRETLARLSSEVESELKQKDEQIAAAQAALASHQKSTADEKALLEIELLQRDQHLREKTELVSQLHEQLSHNSLALRSKDEQLQTLQTAIAETQLRSAEQIRAADEKLEQADAKLQALEQLLLSKQKSLQELKVEMLAKQQRLREMQQDIEQAALALKSSQEHIAQLESEKEVSNFRLEKLSGEKTMLEADRQSLIAQLSQREQLIQDLLQSKEKSNAEVERLTKEKAVLEADQQALLTQLSEQEKLIEDLLQSASWKMTAPLRGMVDLLKRRQ